MPIPNIFSPETQLSSSQINENFQYLEDELAKVKGKIQYIQITSVARTLDRKEDYDPSINYRGRPEDAYNTFLFQKISGIMNSAKIYCALRTSDPNHTASSRLHNETDDIPIISSEVHTNLDQHHNWVISNDFLADLSEDQKRYEIRVNSASAGTANAILEKAYLVIEYQ